MGDVEQKAGGRTEAKFMEVPRIGSRDRPQERTDEPCAASLRGESPHRTPDLLNLRGTSVCQTHRQIRTAALWGWLKTQSGPLVAPGYLTLPPCSGWKGPSGTFTMTKSVRSCLDPECQNSGPHSITF